jgi:hypothetical protein
MNAVALLFGVRLATVGVRPLTSREQRYYPELKSKPGSQQGQLTGPVNIDSYSVQTSSILFIRQKGEALNSSRNSVGNISTTPGPTR